MKNFKKITNELYGAKKAGYKLDTLSERETDEQLVKSMRAKRGNRFIEDKLDSLYDLDGDLYEDENGVKYAVVFVYDGEHQVPLCWQKLSNENQCDERSTKITYRIKPEFIEMWGPDASDETVLTEDEIRTQAEYAEIPLDEIMNQVYPNTESEIWWYRKIAEKENKYHY